MSGTDIPIYGGPPCPQCASTLTRCVDDTYIEDDNLIVIETHHYHCDNDQYDWTVDEPPRSNTAS